ncbi:MAG: hypothetical protein JWN22_604 [Nocardioides sp.]|nr:hypothetical protein [Nocardioides sp.]
MTRHARPFRTLHVTTGIARVALGACALLVAAQLASVAPATAAPSAPAAGATFVDLGTAAGYSVLGGSGVSNTGAATVLAGDLGLSPTGVIAGFPPGTTAGTIHDKDAAAEQAQSDRQAAYDAAAAQTSTGTFAGDQAGVILKPGVYTAAAAISNSGTMTLDADGDSSAVFVFQIGAAFGAAAASKVVLTDGALANNVYWQVVGAVSLGAGAKAVGTFLGAAAITFGEGASIKGRALTPSTVALANSPFTEPKDDFVAPVVTIDGGATRATNDTTPSITGTTDEPVGRPVKVTVAGQTLNTTVSTGGLWSVGAATLPEGTHDVVASITDASLNTGTATQALTVDVTAPLVTINGGARRSTRDRTPTVSGTTDEPAGSTVTVTVAGKTLTAPVAADGTWSADAPTLVEAAHSVVATVDDAAGNAGGAQQTLVVDVTVPVLTIDGGAGRSTSDTSPWTYGTTAEKAGTKVHVSIGGQSLTATVRPGGGWGVSAAALAEGTYKVVASITDAAGNRGTATQALTIGNPGTGPAPGGAHPTYRADASIRRAGGHFVGVGAYGASGQQVSQLLRGSDRKAVFEVRVHNDGSASDRMKIRGTGSSKKLKVTYRAGGKNVTRQVVAGTYRSGRVGPGKTVRLVVTVTRSRGAGPGTHRTFEIRSSSAHAPARRDTVSGAARVVR